MKKKYSMVLGRFQPFHEGHEELIRSILNEGKNVFVAIRDTEVDKDNPYTYEIRRHMIFDVFMDEIASGQLVVEKVPDIEEICYGRSVGWGIREIRLDPKTEAISATEIRQNRKNA